MRYPIAAGLAIGMAFLLAAGGCQNKSGTSPTVKTTGTVTYNGKPMEKVSVTFTPAKGGGRPGNGVTDASGKFTVSTFRSRDGAVPGKHTVTMTTSGSVPMPTDGEEVKLRFPKRYSNPDTSGFSVVVDPGDPNDFKFEMNDDPAPATADGANPNTTD